MSTNRPSTTKPDSRIAPKEAIVTRNKSAQMKRQLRTKDRSMKRFTDLLKSPTKEALPATKIKKKQTSPKAKQSLLKSVERVQNLPQKTFKLSKVIRKEVILIPDEEYYPNKLKRKLAITKVVLKPKNALKVVGEIAGSVKRKCAIPVKATENSPGSQEASHTRLSMAEAMSIMEDQLTDEDLMEILTCPSPVWWEDPPDEEYIEDAIFTRSKVQPSEPTEPIEVDDEMENDTNRFITIPNLSSKSDKFLKKRSKLEDLLGIIKDKSKTDKQNSTKDIFNEDVVVLCSNYRTDTDEIKVNKNNEVTNDGECDSRRSESDDEIMFHNSMNEDELLKDLESMEIPIANQGRSNDVIVIDDDEDMFLDKTTKNKKANVKENKRNKDHEITVGDSIEPVIENNVKMPKDTLSNRKLSKEMSSPKSSDSFSSKSSVVVAQDADTVSDTNVRFLEDHIDSDEGIQDSKDNMAGTSNENTNKRIKNEYKEAVEETEDDKLTVYQIIEEVNEDTIVKPDPELKRNVETKLENCNENMLKEKVTINENGHVKAKVNDTKENKVVNKDEDMPCIVATKTSDNKRIKIENSNELKNRFEAKLSDCYRKCKRAYQRRPKRDEKSDINKNDVIQNAEEIDNFPTMFCDPCKPSFKRVSEDENVKYCLSCSSIFDTHECTYCTKKFKNKIFICVPCKIKFCCDNFYKTHEKQGCSYNTVSRKVVFTQLSDTGLPDGNPNVQVINYSVSISTAGDG